MPELREGYQSIEGWPGPRVVCFDIGGVLVRITMRVAEAARLAGVDLKIDDHMLFTDFPCFMAYQRGQLDSGAYVDQFANALGVAPDKAQLVHNGLAIEPYSGTLELILRLQASGVVTACLSNTNEIHWRFMHESGRFPNVVALEPKAASFQLHLEKPEPAIYRALERMTGERPEAIHFFDDGAANVEGARGCGWRSTLVDPDGDTALQMSRALGL